MNAQAGEVRLGMQGARRRPSMLLRHGDVPFFGTEHRSLWQCLPVKPSSSVPPAPPRARRPSTLRKPRAPPGPPAASGSSQPSQGAPAPPSPPAPSPPSARPEGLASPAAADSAPGGLLAGAPLEPAAGACAALRAPCLCRSGGEPCRAATSASDADAAGDTSSCTRLLSAAAAPAQHVPELVGAPNDLRPLSRVVHMHQRYARTEKV